VLFYRVQGVGRQRWGAIDGHRLSEDGEAEVANKGRGRGEGMAGQAPIIAPVSVARRHTKDGGGTQLT
jgi:hypothetical protein